MAAGRSVLDRARKAISLVCAQGGINAAKNLKGEGDSTCTTSTTPFTAAISWPINRP